MRTIRFWAPFTDAARATWRFAKEHVVATGIVIVCSAIGSPVVALLLGVTAVWENWATLLGFSVFGLLGLVTLSFLVNLWLAPYRLIAAACDERIRQSETAAAAAAAAAPARSGSNQLRDRAVIEALETIAAPAIAHASLPGVRAIKVRRAGTPELFVKSEQSRRREVLHDCYHEQDRLVVQLVEAGADPKLRETLTREEARITGESDYATQLPTDPVQWPDRKEKRQWHIVDARADILERTRDLTVSQLESAARGNALRMNLAIRNLKEMTGR